MADWHQSIMFHMPPLVAISELIGDMPEAVDAWDADQLSEPEVQDRHAGEARVHAGLRSISDYVRVLMQDRIENWQAAALRCVSMSNMYLIITGTLTNLPALRMTRQVLMGTGLSCIIVSGHVMSTISESAPAIQRALSRWQDVWKFLARRSQGDALTGCGIERYSDGLCWAARTMLESLVSREELHPFFKRVGHDTLAEFHGFLVQHQKKPSGSTSRSRPCDKGHGRKVSWGPSCDVGVPMLQSGPALHLAAIRL